MMTLDVSVVPYTKMNITETGNFTYRKQIAGQSML